MMPYHLNQLFNAERPKSPQEIRRADEQLGKAAKSAAGLWYRVIGPVRSIARKIVATISDGHDAHRYAIAELLAPEREIFVPGSEADTYGEFLYRTSFPLPHEPSARARAARSERRADQRCR